MNTLKEKLARAGVKPAPVSAAHVANVEPWERLAQAVVASFGK